jgi:alpha-L-fucosidase
MKSALNIVLAALFLFASIAFAQTQTTSDPLAPTAGKKSAADIDREWQLSVSKYAAARASILRDVDQQISAGPYYADWETLRHCEMPQWYKDAKFGIFIHWGVYSVPGAGNEWYPRNMYQQKDPAFQYHLRIYGSQDKFGYKDLIPLFTASRWDPNDWAKLFKDAGARYVIPVAEHHDGFAMYDSAVSDWTAAKMGPMRDTTGELAAAVRAQGLHFGTSLHRAEHNFFFDGGRTFRSDVNDPQFASLYGPAHSWLQAQPESMMNDWTYVSPEFANDWLARAAEIVLRYKPEVMYFDWWIGQPNYRPNVTKFAAFYYNFDAHHNIPGVIDFKDFALDWHAGARDFERGLREGIEPQHWQTDTSISNLSWGYIEHDELKSADFLVHQLVDIVSKNGSLLLNIGPRPDGTIPEEVRSTLLQIGAWLKQNGDAIYDTTPWKVYGEGPTKVKPGFGNDKETKPYTTEDFRFTQKGTTIYAIAMAWPADRHFIIHSLGSAQQAKALTISNVELLGSSAKLEFRQSSDASPRPYPENLPLPSVSPPPILDPRAVAFAVPDPDVVFRVLPFLLLSA